MRRPPSSDSTGASATCADSGVQVPTFAVHTPPNHCSHNRTPYLAVVDEARLAAALPLLIRAGRDREAENIDRLGRGMNSTTLAVDINDGHLVAKWVPTATATALDTGSAMASRLAGHGLYDIASAVMYLGGRKKGGLILTQLCPGQRRTCCRNQRTSRCVQQVPRGCAGRLLLYAGGQFRHDWNI